MSRQAAVLTVPAATDLRAHLLASHRMPAAVLDTHEADEWRLWHEAEHRMRDCDRSKDRHLGHLSHRHSGASK